jgi:hypothetical protein
MPAPDWLTYVGAVTGTIGTLTGIAGAVMGYKSYRRVSQLKALDLRLELRKQEVDADEALRALPALIKKSRESRFAVAAATGRLGSGAMDSFKNRIETDQAAVQALLGQLRPSADGYATLTHSELEDRLGGAPPAPYRE